jgi:hypothetical protein
MPILASLNAKNRPKSPFSIGVLFSIISEFTVRLAEFSPRSHPQASVNACLEATAVRAC